MLFAVVLFVCLINCAPYHGKPFPPLYCEQFKDDATCKADNACYWSKGEAYTYYPGVVGCVTDPDIQNEDACKKVIGKYEMYKRWSVYNGFGSCKKTEAADLKTKEDCEMTRSAGTVFIWTDNGCKTLYGTHCAHFTSETTCKPLPDLQGWDAKEGNPKRKCAWISHGQWGYKCTEIYELKGCYELKTKNDCENNYHWPSNGDQCSWNSQNLCQNQNGETAAKVVPTRRKKIKRRKRRRNQKNRRRGRRGKR